MRGIRKKSSQHLIEVRPMRPHVQSLVGVGEYRGRSLDVPSAASKTYPPEPGIQKIKCLLAVLAAMGERYFGVLDGTFPRGPGPKFPTAPRTPPTTSRQQTPKYFYFLYFRLNF